MSTPEFKVGDHVRRKPTRTGWITYMGKVTEIDEEKGTLRLHNSGPTFFQFDQVELVPSIDPTSLNKNGNASTY